MCRVRAKILVARKLGREQKRERSGEGVGLPHPLPAPFPFLLSPQFSGDQNLYSRDTGTLATQANINSIK